LKIIKVAHIIIALDIGGAERFLARLVKNTKGVQHTIICLTKLGVLGATLKEQGVNIIDLGLNRRNILFKSHFCLKNILSDISPDIVHTWMYHSDLLGGISAKLLGYKVIWSIRNSELDNGGTILKRMLRSLCGIISYILPDKIVCVAQKAKDVHVGCYYQEKKMVVIGNGFNTTTYSPSIQKRKHYREQLNIANKIVVGSIGRYTKAKNHKLFIKSMLLAMEKNDELVAILIGKDINTKNNELMSIISKSKNKKNFYFLGVQDDISGYLNCMDIFCLHSDTEGFPNVLGEAMSCGLACITTDVGDSKLILNNEIYTCPPGDYNKLSKSILKLSFMSVVNRIELGKNNRINVKQNYSLDKVLDKYQILYKEVVGFE